MPLFPASTSVLRAFGTLLHDTFSTDAFTQLKERGALIHAYPDVLSCGTQSDAMDTQPFMLCNLPHLLAAALLLKLHVPACTS